MSDQIIDLNFTGVGTERPPFEVISEGEYSAKIADVDVRQPKSEGKFHTVGIKLEVVENGETKSCYDWIYLAQNNLWRVRSLLEAVYNEDMSDKEIGLNPRELIGQTVGVTLSVKDRKDDNAKPGDKTNQVEAYFSV